MTGSATPSPAGSPHLPGAPRLLRYALRLIAAELATLPDQAGAPAYVAAGRQLAAVIASMPESRAELAVMRRCERALAAALFAALAARDSDLAPIGERAEQALRAIR